MSPAVKSKLLTVAELADRLRISKRSAYRVAREMMHVEIAGRVLVPEAAVDRYLEMRLKDPAWGSSTSAAAPGTRTTSTVKGGAAASRPARATTSGRLRLVK